jgi:hypothetical protein
MNFNLTPLSEIWDIIHKKRMNHILDLKYADDGKKKYKVQVLNPETKRLKWIKFGAFGYNDFTQTRDKKKGELIELDISLIILMIR